MMVGAGTARPALPDSALTPSTNFIAAQAPRLDQLFQALDLGRPGLQPAMEAWQAGHCQEACRELLRYYRDRPVPPREVVAGWNAPDLPLPSPSEAAELLRTELRLQNVSTIVRRRADGGIDWTWSGPRDDPEWTWMLNRHGWFPSLAALWSETGDGRYAGAIATQITDWVQACPYPGRLSFSPSWRPLEAARRILDSWPQSFEALRDAPEFDAAARLLLLASLPEHADALRRHASFWGGNHLLTEKIALAKIAVVWPEFRDAPVWLRDSAQAVVRELQDQTYPDGAFKELTNLYQAVILRDAQDFLVLMAASGHGAEAEVVRERVMAMWRYFAGVTKPSGFGPLNNASDEVGNLALMLQPDGRTPSVAGLPAEVIELVRNRPARPQFFPWAGVAVMRGGNGAAAQWAMFDAGPYGTAHQQSDRLHLDVFAGGRDVLVDAGRYTYQPGAWLDYFSGPRSHNVLLIDGHGAEAPPPAAKGQPLPVTVKLAPEWDYFAAEAAFAPDPWRGLGVARWTRGVLYVHGAGWIVIDEISAFGPATVRALWHFHPSLEVAAHEGGLVARADGQPVFTLRELLHRDWRLALSRGAEPPGVAGWYAPLYNVKLPATEAGFSTRLTHPVRYVWQLAPVSVGDWRVTCAEDGSGGLVLATKAPGPAGAAAHPLVFRFGSSLLVAPL
jgi:hypothetical protein